MTHARRAGLRPVIACGLTAALLVTANACTHSPETDVGLPPEVVVLEDPVDVSSLPLADGPPAEFSPQQKLMAKRAAEVDAYRRPAGIVAGRPVDAGSRVRLRNVVFGNYRWLTDGRVVVDASMPIADAQNTWQALHSSRETDGLPLRLTASGQSAIDTVGLGRAISQ